TDHSREVMPHGPESGDKKIDVLGTPARLRQGEYRQDQQRRTNIKQQVTPAIQDPKIRMRPCGGNCRNGLWPRKSGNVLHVEERANYSLEALKINAGPSFAARKDARKHEWSYDQTVEECPCRTAQKPKSATFFAVSATVFAPLHGNPRKFWDRPGRLSGQF